MVYCGKPSKGCQSCRERKIRCDQAIPSCSQCTRIDRKCEYRNLLDLSFRNESSAVIEKAKSKPQTRRKADADTKSSRPKRLKTIPTTTASSHADATNNWSLVEFSSHQQTHVTSPFSDQSIESDESYMPMPDYVLPNSRLSPSPDELAVGFFMTNYVTSRNFNARGHFAYVEDIGRRDGLNYVVTAAINSVGFAGLANQAGSPPLMRRARREYTNALRQVNSALQCNIRAVEDSTLMSIMVLSVFETITATSPTSMKAWTEHINGATALVKLRGRSQFDTPIGRSLFQQVTAHLLISCVQREIPIPKDIVELRAEAANYVDATDLSWLSLNSVADYTVFRAAVKDGTFRDSKSIIEAALKIDNDFAQTFSHVDPRWLYERVYTSPDIYPELIYDGSYDVYQNFWTSQVWNGMRTCRVLLNEVIREKLLEGFSAVPPLFTDAKYTAQLQKSTDTLIKMRDDILHSLPQHLGFVTRKPFSEQIAPGTPGPLDPGFAQTRISPVTQFSDTVTDFTDNLDNWFSARHSQRPPTPSQTPPPSPVLKAAGGYFILWPLYVCAVAKVTSESTRTFITNRLRYIGESMGIKQALALARYLEIGMKILKQQNDIEMVD